MKKYVLLIGLFIISFSLLGKTREQINNEIFKVIINRGNLDSALDAQNPPMSELEKDPYIFFRDENYPLEEIKTETVLRAIITTSIIDASIVNQLNEEKNISTWGSWTSFFIMFFFICVPFYIVKRSTMTPRKRRFT